MGDQDRSKLGNDRDGSQRIHGPRQADRTKTIRKRVRAEIRGIEVRSDIAYNSRASKNSYGFSLLKSKFSLTAVSHSRKEAVMGGGTGT